MNPFSIKFFAFFVYLGTFLFPFQIFALSVAGSKYDLTSFVYLFIALWSTFKSNLVNKRALLLFSIFLLIQIFVYLFFGFAPFYRLFSGLVWFGGLLLLLWSGYRIDYDRKIVMKIILGLLLLTAFYIFLQRFFLGIDRPKAWFGEPSFAGLCLYSGSAGIFSILYSGITFSRLQKRNLRILFLVIFFAGTLTFSMHIVTFIMTISFLLISKITLRSLPILLLCSLVITLGVTYLVTIPHYFDRINLANPESNISLLSWLEGFDQMKTAISRSPIFGLGLGSTGYFSFESNNTIALENLKIGSLNLKDAFSGFFRLVIEIGLISVLLFIWFLTKRFRKFKNIYFSSNNRVAKKNYYSEFFLFIFAFSLMMGFLLKEPSYARSYVYMAFFLIGTNTFLVSKAEFSK
jgi:hypothetical protein